jgi:signal transduction histidine kinase
MLFEFVTLYRDAIIARAREKLTARAWPPASASELENGVPKFLTQLSETLRWEATDTPFSAMAISATATSHGRDLLALGFTLSQVVHDYGDICQAVTELALEQNAPITTTEFHILNRSLDTAIAEAVTEHARITASSRSADELERIGQLAHELRNMLNMAFLAFDAVKRGTVAINGSTGAVLGRSLIGLRDLVDTTLADIRVTASHQRAERVVVASFLNDVVIAARLQAEYSGLQFAVEPIAPELTVDIDRQLLESAAMNLLLNAFKYTRPGGSVVLRAYRKDGRLRVEVEDECGGFPDDRGDPFEPFGIQSGTDRTGLGLGLSIARKAVRAHGGDIQLRNIPGRGCTFVIELALAGEHVPAQPALAQ